MNIYEQRDLMHTAAAEADAAVEVNEKFPAEYKDEDGYTVKWIRKLLLTNEGMGGIDHLVVDDSGSSSGCSVGFRIRMRITGLYDRNGLKATVHPDNTIELQVLGCNEQQTAIKYLKTILEALEGSTPNQEDFKPKFESQTPF